MNQVFQALLDEATFTREILGSGVTQLGKANYARKGLYFESFTSISTGLERIGKLCLMLDHYINNDGVFPESDDLKKSIGHDLAKLYSKSQVIIKSNSLNLKLDDVLHEKIIKILTEFSKGDRYSNIDSLTSCSTLTDPIRKWNQEIDAVIYENRVLTKKKKSIEENAKLIDTLISTYTMIRHTSESREDLTTVESASLLTGKTEAISKYRQQYVLQIIRY